MKNSWTHTAAEWLTIAEKLGKPWPYVRWPNGAIQRRAEHLAHTITSMLENTPASNQEQTEITYHVDDDDWDGKAAMLIAGA